MPNNSTNVIKWVGLLVTICLAAITVLGAASWRGDAKLDADKLDKATFAVQQEADKEMRKYDRQQLEKIDGKLDRLLEK